MKALTAKYSKETVIVNLAATTPHPFTLKVYDASNIHDLADKIEAFGGLINNPIAIGPDDQGVYTIVAGRRRTEAASYLGWDQIALDVIKGLPAEDEHLFILESNNQRVKTPVEFFKEIKEYEKELTKRQGQRPQPDSEEPYNQRKEISKRMKVAESLVRDLKTVGEAPNGLELLASIDGKINTVTSLASKIRKSSKQLDFSHLQPVTEISLDPLPCPCCGISPTPRVIVINGTLQIAA